MTSLSRFLLIWIAASLSANAFAAAGNGIPSHCREYETEFLSARMYRLGATKAESILSLCGDRETEPLERMVYRFGAIGKVEMELVASAQHKAGISEQSDSASHAGLISIVFYKGPYAYEVSEGVGMTTGVRLNGYRNRKQIVGYESYEYESELVRLNFDRSPSPIFKQTNPFRPW